MLLVRVYVNLDEIDTVGVVNTGHVDKKTKKHLYKICFPEKYKEQFNHVEIYHTRSEPYTVLVEKIMHVLNNEKPKDARKEALKQLEKDFREFEKDFREFDHGF